MIRSVKYNKFTLLHSKQANMERVSNCITLDVQKEFFRHAINDLVQSKIVS